MPGIIKSALAASLPFADDRALVPPEGRTRVRRADPGDWTSGHKRHSAGKVAQDLLLWQLRVAAQRDPDLAGATDEFRFHRDRLWRLDVAIPRWRVGVEIHGGVFMRPKADDPTRRGGHSRGAQQVKDWEKANEAQIAGWIVLQILPEWVKKGIALTLVERAVRTRKAEER